MPLSRVLVHWRMPGKSKLTAPAWQLAKPAPRPLNCFSDHFAADHGLAVLIHSTIEVAPFASNTDVRLVDSPGEVNASCPTA